MNIILKLEPIGSFSTISNTVLSQFEHLDIATINFSFVGFIVSMSNVRGQRLAALSPVGWNDWLGTFLILKRRMATGAGGVLVPLPHRQTLEQGEMKMKKTSLVLYGEPEVNHLIHVVKDQPRTTSLRVAEEFGKRHDNVLRDIEKLDCSEDFRLLNFEEILYLDEYGRSQPMVEMTQDGWIFLVMGFTGKKAAEKKEKYIHCFNQMRQALERIRNADRQARRLEGKVARRELTDAIAALEEYALGQNPDHKHKQFTNYTKMVYRALFILESGIAKNFRALLEGIQLVHLESAESIITKTIYDEMQNCVDYHEIYKIAKDKIETFAEAVGKTVPGQRQLSASSRKAFKA